jgi:hypothetical protein
MTQAELKFMTLVPNELRDIREQLEQLNKTIALIANALNEHKA